MCAPDNCILQLLRIILVPVLFISCCIVTVIIVFTVIVIVNHKLEISTAPTKAKSWELAYSQALILNKIDRQRVRCRESDRQSGGYGGWCLELRRGRR